MTDRLWEIVDRMVRAFPADFDTNELRKALSYLRAHLDDTPRFYRYLQEQSQNRDFGRSNQTLQYRRSLLAAAQLGMGLSGPELALVLGWAAREVSYRVQTSESHASRRSRV